ncbi:hypothetical protein NLJ89_g9431 [Agrocybe chaxingu]|uniref:Uncharacterized protein n=1 Tax=Agrocybe chaxingu TaxID=84603 RepID=A0A9W8JZZ9_9AGAR|nr:hypothetical protein NLJ89_g9431 [Agrocybe chaxingu]
MLSQFVAVAAENSTSSHFEPPSVSFDNGLVEISALTTLIGSSAAASLVLGSRGPTGLAWAATSAFCTIAVVKACISGAIPGWLQETIGVRSSASDLAVGLQLDLGSNSYGAKRVRKTLDRPIAIQCRGDIGNETSSSMKDLGSDVYAFDYSTSAMLNRVPETEPGQLTRVFAYARYNFVRKHSTGIQMGATCLSFLKLTESYILWRNNSEMLAMVTSIPWFYFVIAAIVEEVIELRRAANPETMLGPIDILSGTVPAVGRPGSSRKIIIGAAQNPRHALRWTIMWSVGAIICTSSTLMTYLLLGKQSTEVVLVWVGFQALWMALRLLVHHLVEPYDPVESRQLADQSLSSLSPDMKMRVLRLAMALSKYQASIHPRGDYSYLYDCFTASDIPPLLAQHASVYPTNNFTSSGASLASIRVSIKAVIGDTTLSSATWISGSKPIPMDLYDSCVVVFNIGTKDNLSSDISLPSYSSSHLAVPAVRVLSGKTVGPSLPTDPEKDATIHFVPKGSSNIGFGLTWLYWIPLDSGGWLFVSTAEDSLDVRGRQVGCLMTDGEVTEQLSAGRLNIGFSHVDDVKAALEMSKRGFMDIRRILE